MDRDEQSGKRDLRIVLTGERRQGRFLVWVEQQPLWLPYSQFKLLTALVKQHVESGGREFLAKAGVVYPASVSRLRKALDEAAGDGTGKELIQTGVGAEYRLAPAVRIQTHRPLTPTRLLPATLLQKLDAA